MCGSSQEPCKPHSECSWEGPRRPREATLGPDRGPYGDLQPRLAGPPPPSWAALTPRELRGSVRLPSQLQRGVTVGSPPQCHPEPCCGDGRQPRPQRNALHSLSLQREPPTRRRAAGSGARARTASRTAGWTRGPAGRPSRSPAARLSLWPLRFPAAPPPSLGPSSLSSTSSLSFFSLISCVSSISVTPPSFLLSFSLSFSFLLFFLVLLPCPPHHSLSSPPPTSHRSVPSFKESKHLFLGLSLPLALAEKVFLRAGLKPQPRQAC